MSIICSLIKKDYAILKSDTRGTFNEKPLPFVCPKGMKFEDNGRIILMTFCGELNFNGQDTFCHLKSEKEALFRIYDNYNEIVAWEMGEYLRKKYSPLIHASVCKTLSIHIVTTKDFEKDPIICQVWLDFRENVEQRDFAGQLGLENNYRFWCAGGDDALFAIGNANTDEIRFANDNFSQADHRLNAKMQIAITADITCGKPVDTFSFRYPS